MGEKVHGKGGIECRNEDKNGDENWNGGIECRNEDKNGDENWKLPFLSYSSLARLTLLDPTYAASLFPNDWYRLKRALDICLQSGRYSGHYHTCSNVYNVCSIVI